MKGYTVYLSISTLSSHLACKKVISIFVKRSFSFEYHQLYFIRLRTSLFETHDMELILLSPQTGSWKKKANAQISPKIDGGYKFKDGLSVLYLYIYVAD